MQTARQPMPPLKDLRPYTDFTVMLGRDKSTIWRWINNGIKTRSGVIKLNAWDTGEWCTTETEVRDFIQRRTEGKLGNKSSAPTTSPAIQKRNAAAKKRLAAKGMKLNSK